MFIYRRHLLTKSPSAQASQSKPLPKPTKRDSKYDSTRDDEDYFKRQPWQRGKPFRMPPYEYNEQPYETYQVQEPVRETKWQPPESLKKLSIAKEKEKALRLSNPPERDTCERVRPNTNSLKPSSLNQSKAKIVETPAKAKMQQAN